MLHIDNYNRNDVESIGFGDQVDLSRKPFHYTRTIYVSGLDCFQNQLPP